MRTCKKCGWIGPLAETHVNLDNQGGLLLCPACEDPQWPDVNFCDTCNPDGEGKTPGEVPTGEECPDCKGSGEVPHQTWCRQKAASYAG